DFLHGPSAKLDGIAFDAYGILFHASAFGIDGRRAGLLTLASARRLILSAMRRSAPRGLASALMRARGVVLRDAGGVARILRLLAGVRAARRSRFEGISLFDARRGAAFPRLKSQCAALNAAPLWRCHRRWLAGHRVSGENGLRAMSPSRRKVSSRIDDFP